MRERLRALLIPESDDPDVVAAAPQVTIREVARRFWPEARPYRRWLPVLLVLIVLGTLISTAEIWLFGLVVDDVLVPGDLGPLGPLAAAFVGLTLAGGLISFTDDYLSTWISERFLLQMRTRVFGHMQRLGLDVFDRHRHGDLISRLTTDVERIEEFVLSGLADGISAALRILFFTGALFVLEWRLAIIAIVVAPLFWLVARGFSRLIKTASRENARREGSLSAVAEESLANAPLIQALNRQDAELRRFRRENEGMIEAELATTRIEGIYSPIVNLIELGGILLVFLLGTVAVADGDLTVGGLLVFVTYLTRLFSPVRDLASLANDLFRALAGAERVIELLDEEPQVTDHADARPLADVRGAIEFEGVSFRYPGEATPALDGIDLEIAPGQTVALVGPSGAGKTTLARLLLRFYDPTAGVVRLDGHDLRDVRLDSLRRSVSILLQEALIMRGSVRSNIAMAAPGATDDRIVAAAAAAGADEFIRALPAGYDTDVGERGRRLSGGQRQRVAIARALVADAPVLVLDEPSTGLDARAKAELIGPIRRLMEGRTAVVISHDLVTTRDADLIVVLDGGRVAELGSHAELLAAHGLYALLWELHSGERAAIEAEAALESGAPA